MSVERIRGNDRMNVHYRGLRLGHVGKAIAAMPATACAPRAVAACRASAHPITMQRHEVAE